MAAERADLAEIDEGGRVALVAQEVGGGIGDVALGEAVERHRHAFACKGDAGGADVDGAEIDEVARDVAGAGEDVVLDRGA